MIDEPEISEEANDLVDHAIAEAKRRGIDPVDLGHALISAGLAELRGNTCDDHLYDQLAFVESFIQAKMIEL